MSLKESKNLKVFVVDDSDVLRESLIRMLSELERVEVVGEAAGRDQAIAEVARLKPDVVILDIQLQHGNGIEVLAEIKKAAPGPTVIMLTNYPHAQFREKCLKTGADYFFYKATEFTKVKDVVRQLAGDSSA